MRVTDAVAAVVVVDWAWAEVKKVKVAALSSRANWLEKCMAEAGVVDDGMNCRSSRRLTAIELVRSSVLF